MATAFVRRAKKVGARRIRRNGGRALACDLALWQEDVASDEEEEFQAALDEAMATEDYEAARLEHDPDPVPDPAFDDELGEDFDDDWDEDFEEDFDDLDDDVNDDWDQGEDNFDEVGELDKHPLGALDFVLLDRARAIGETNHFPN